MTDKNKVLSVRDMVVEFEVRDRILTAIRNISIDLYEGEECWNQMDVSLRALLIIAVKI